MSNNMEKEIEELKIPTVGWVLDDTVTPEKYNAALDLILQLHKRIEVLEEDMFTAHSRILGLMNKAGLDYLKDK